MMRPVCFLIVLLCALLRAGGAAPPNIVFIVADDLGVHDLRCYGREDHATPRLDALAAQGARFTSAYCAQPICSASRAALMTGKSPAELHLTTYLPGRPDAPSQLLLHPPIEKQLPLAEVTIAERLKAAGYATACIGKWHLGDVGFSPREQGFDGYFPGDARTEPDAVEGGKGEFLLTMAAVEFIKINRDRPFFLYVAHNNPHIPLAAQKERVEKFAGAFNPTYAAMIETLDESVGRIVDCIDELGLGQQTLIVFTSDNGGLHVPEGDLTPATHNTPFRAGKGYLYEGGLRIPLIARWTDTIPAGNVIEAPTINSDWPATLASFALPDETPMPLEAMLRGESSDVSRTFYWHFPHYTNQGGRPGGAIRDGDWKLIEHYEDGRLELFDLAKDTAERHDVGAEHPERVATLRGKLEAWRRTGNVQQNVVNPAFEQARWQAIYEEFDTSAERAADSFTAIQADWSTWRKRMNAAADRRRDPGSATGAVMLHAREATVHGEKLRYEPEAHKDTLGYWVNPSDWAEWQFTAPVTGDYSVEILQGCGTGSGGAEVELRCGDQMVRFTVEETGHFQRFIPRGVGRLTLASDHPSTLEVRPVKKPNAAVMDLRRITLRGVASE
jgi:arylsulfatase A